MSSKNEMDHIKIFEEFDFVESETFSYEPPKFVIKPYPGDTGYELVRKKYNRFIWVAPGLGKGKIDKGEVAENNTGNNPDKKKSKKLEKIKAFKDFIGDEPEK